MNFWREMFEGQDGKIDEKRVVGVPTFVLGVLIAVAIGAVLIVGYFTGKQPDGIVAPGLEVASFLTAAGSIALAGGVASDKMRSTIPKATPTSRGQQQ